MRDFVSLIRSAPLFMYVSGRSVSMRGCYAKSKSGTASLPQRTRRSQRTAYNIGTATYHGGHGGLPRNDGELTPLFVFLCDLCDLCGKMSCHQFPFEDTIIP